jgi:hypothetical protein
MELENVETYARRGNLMTPQLDWELYLHLHFFLFLLLNSTPFTFLSFNVQCYFTYKAKKI